MPERNRHHIYYPSTAYRRHTLPYLIRQHPVNINETEIWRHGHLHKDVGSLAVMSVDLAKVCFDKYESILTNFNAANHDRHYRLGYFARTIELYDGLKRGRGAMAREAGYFSEVLHMQMPYLLPEEK